MIVASISRLDQFVDLLGRDKPPRVFASILYQPSKQGQGTADVGLAAAYQTNDTLVTLQLLVGTVPADDEVAPMPEEMESLDKARAMYAQIEATVVAYGGLPIEGSVVHER
jgi:hypothetical protein